MANKYIQRRWLDFRNGHSIYLAFILTFINFILITHNFAIEQSSFLSEIFDSLSVFAVVFIVIYMPAAMLIGYWHRRRQYTIENEAPLQEDWISAWLIRHQVRLLQGNATPDETDEVMKYFESILKRYIKDIPSQLK